MSVNTAYLTLTNGTLVDLSVSEDHETLTIRAGDSLDPRLRLDVLKLARPDVEALIVDLKALHNHMAPLHKNKLESTRANRPRKDA